MNETLVITLAIILVALVFDFINGFHDSANSIATVVSTRVLTPLQAVTCAALFNVLAAFGFGTHVAKTIGKGMVDPTGITVWVILAGLLGAIAWDLITWYWGLPTSSSHASSARSAAPRWYTPVWGVLILSGFQKTMIFILVAPLLGMTLGFLIQIAVYSIFRRSTPSKVDRSSELGSCSPLRCIPSRTGPTTRKRPWASWWRC
jgi:PiT family inorganic phosphate transporter